MNADPQYTLEALRKCFGLNNPEGIRLNAEYLLRFIKTDPAGAEEYTITEPQLSALLLIAGGVGNPNTDSLCDLLTP